MLARRFLVLLTFAVALAAILPTAASAQVFNTDSPYIESPPVAAAGITLTGHTGEWYSDYDGISYSAQWLRCDDEGDACAPIAGANDFAYQMTGADKGSTVRLEVTADDGDPGGVVESLTTDYVGPISYEGWSIDNGVVQLGVRTTGALNVPGLPSASEGVDIVGLRQVSNNLDSIAPGSPQEAWGVYDAASGTHGWANDNGYSGNTQTDDDIGDTDVPSHHLDEVSFDHTNSTAESVVNVDDNNGDPALQVTHEFKPTGISNQVYRVDVTLTALPGHSFTHLKYRRLTDWDIEPTAFNEAVTLMAGDSPYLLGTSDEGFSSPNPMDPLDYNEVHGEAIKTGPGDIGAAFDFDFGALSPGQSRTFKLWYGVSPTENEALGVLHDLKAEAYSIGENGDNFETDGYPAVFFNAFTGIGGTPATTDLTAVAVDTSIDDFDLTGTSATATITSNEPSATFECKLDGAPWAACTSPHAMTGLTEGYHWFRARASFGGDTDPTSASRFFKVDLTKPVIAFTDTPPEVTTSDSATFRVKSTGGDFIDELTFECSLDGGDFTSCSLETGLVSLALGWYNFRIRATDSGNNVSDAISYDWFVADDLSGGVPETTLDTTNHQGLNATYTFSSDIPGSTFECSMNGSAWQACDTPKAYVGLAAGAYTFKVHAVFNGVPDGTPEVDTFTVDAPPAPPAGPPIKKLPAIAITKPKSGAKSFKLTLSCPGSTCDIAGFVKIGKKKFPVTAKAAPGDGPLELKFGKKLKKALKKAKKEKVKASYSLTIKTATGETKSVTGKF
ncbi:MAG: hypothetical protein ACRDKI_00550 [Solirubrobacterales bacterium]